MARPYERGASEIDVAHGRVFIGTSDHGLYALRASNGSAIWRFETLGVVQSEPLYDSDMDVVYFGSNDGALYAVHASDGRLVWRFESGAEVARQPVVVGEMRDFANGAAILFAIDRRTGKGIWHYTHAGAQHGGSADAPAPVRPWRCFIAFQPGAGPTTRAREASDGRQDLSAEVVGDPGPEGLRYLDVDTAPVPDDLGPSDADFRRELRRQRHIDQDAALRYGERTSRRCDRPRSGGSSASTNRAPSSFQAAPPVPAHEALLASGAPAPPWALE